ncbi:SIR2 family histone deacetylase [Penicillium verhagenii]|nr:SIR2 family histone deacetylase [Penicillium verhagenii]
MTEETGLPEGISPEDLKSFTEHLKGSRRILALVGAGLSASSGLPTFRGAGGLWRSYDSTALATPEAFEENPGLVWQFYSYRRHMALGVKPNKAHYALAALARENVNFLTVSQNVDGLCERAQHPGRSLHLVHGSLFEVKCHESECDYWRADDFHDPIVPALEIPTLGLNLPASRDNEVDISDVANPVPDLTRAELPQCPQCDGLLRPGVVWFGEPLDEGTLKSINRWIKKAPVDLMLVIGTSSNVYPAAGYTEKVRKAGARVAVINMDPDDRAVQNLQEGDWFFQGDAATIIPEILKSVIGEVEEDPLPLPNSNQA